MLHKPVMEKQYSKNLNHFPESTKANMIKNTYNLRKYKNNKMIKNVNKKMIKNVKEGSANIL